MKQIGARQEAGLIGGLGVCGRELCCANYITEFKSITTSAARTQDLSLNPQKLAGQCGKLKCCLNYEVAAYMDAHSRYPKVSSRWSSRTAWPTWSRRTSWRRPCTSPTRRAPSPRCTRSGLRGPRDHHDEPQRPKARNAPPGRRTGPPRSSSPPSATTASAASTSPARRSAATGTEQQEQGQEGNKPKRRCIDRV